MLDISSMDLVENVSPTTGTIVVKKVDGVTYDKYIDDIHNEADEVINHIEKSVIQVNGRVTRPCSSIKQLIATRRRLEYLKGYLGEKRNHISDFAHAWFENGLYGDGFMHGDLHAGNIMVFDKGATIIDFGNCIRLSKDEQDHIRNMVSKASLGGYGEDVIKTFRNLLSDEAKTKLDTILADPQKEEFKKNLFGVFTKLNLERLNAIAATFGTDLAIPSRKSLFVSSHHSATFASRIEYSSSHWSGGRNFSFRCGRFGIYHLCIFLECLSQMSRMVFSRSSETASP